MSLAARQDTHNDEKEIVRPEIAVTCWHAGSSWGGSF